MRKRLLQLNSVAVFVLLALLFTCNTAAFAQHTVTVKWTAPTNDVNGNPLPASGPGSITGYNVKRAASQAGPFVTVASPLASPYTDTPLPAPCPTAGCTLWYEVTAVSSIGESVPSTAISAVVPPPATVIPSAPLAITVTVN